MREREGDQSREVLFSMTHRHSKYNLSTHAMTVFASSLRILLATSFVAYPAVSGMPVLSKSAPGPTYITTRNTIAYTTSITYPETTFCPAFVTNYLNGSAINNNGVQSLPGCGNDDKMIPIPVPVPGNVEYKNVPGCAWPEPHCPAGFTPIDTQNVAEPYGMGVGTAQNANGCTAGGSLNGCNVVCVTTAVCKSP